MSENEKPLRTAAELFPALAGMLSDLSAPDIMRYPFDPSDRVSLLTVIGAMGVVFEDASCSVDGVVDTAQETLAQLDHVLPARSREHDMLSFSIASFAAEALQQRGQGVPATIFLQRALCEPAGDGGWEPRSQRLRLWDPITHDLEAGLLEVTLRFYAATYALAWRRPRSDDFADALWARSEEAVRASLERHSELEGLGFVPWTGIRWALPAVLHRIQWALRSGRRDGREEFEIWEQLLEQKDLPREIRKMVLSFPAFSTSPVSDRPQEEWAEQLIREFDGDLTPPLLLRALCSTCAGREEELLARFDEIVAAADAHRGFDHEGDSVVERAYSRSQGAVAVSWAVRTLVHGRHLDHAMRLLAAWSPVAPPTGVVADPLFFMPTSIVGTLWARGDQVSPDPQSDPPNTLPELSETIDAAFNTVIELRSDRSWTEADARTGYPVDDEAERFEGVSRRHVRLDELRRVADGVAKNCIIVPWPMIRAPLQALTLQELDRVWPISASLAEPLPCRPLRKVVVMGRGSYTSPFERQAVRAVFKANEIDVCEVEIATKDEFCRAYEDPGVDALWLCSHGAQDHVRPHLSGLALDDGEFVSLPELAALTVPDADYRRLLMLNVCDGGAVPMLEGSLALGVAATLASPSQTVISHLWPVQPIPAAAFASLLALGLRDGTDHLSAFGSALRILASGPGAISNALAVEPDARELIERIVNNDLPWDSAFVWGSPIMVV